MCHRIHTRIFFLSFHEAFQVWQVSLLIWFCLSKYTDMLACSVTSFKSRCMRNQWNFFSTYGLATLWVIAVLKSRTTNYSKLSKLLDGHRNFFWVILWWLPDGYLCFSLYNDLLLSILPYNAIPNHWQIIKFNSIQFGWNNWSDLPTASLEQFYVQTYQEDWQARNQHCYKTILVTQV